MRPRDQPGSSRYRGENWAEQKALALARDRACTLCGATARLIGHHLKPYRLHDSYQEANRLANVATVCVPCHPVAERESRRNHPEINLLRPVHVHAVPCEGCGVTGWESRGHRAKFCAGCCTYTCAFCRGAFTSAKRDRAPKYCGRACRNLAIESDRGKCAGCGARCNKSAARCRPCDTAWYRSNPSAPRRGRRHSNPRR
jgi:hypothetical protein